MLIEILSMIPSYIKIEILVERQLWVTLGQVKGLRKQLAEVRQKIPFFHFPLSHGDQNVLLSIFLTECLPWNGTAV